MKVSLLALLGLAARHGRIILVAGLAAGIALPDLALAMRPWLQEMVAGLLFFAALRIGPRDVVQVFVPEYVVGHWWVRVYFAQLRRKLEDVPSAPRHFITEPGLGYRFEP